MVGFGAGVEMVGVGAGVEVVSLTCVGMKLKYHKKSSITFEVNEGIP